MGLDIKRKKECMRLSPYVRPIGYNLGFDGNKKNLANIIIHYIPKK